MIDGQSFIETMDHKNWVSNPNTLQVASHYFTEVSKNYLTFIKGWLEYSKGQLNLHHWKKKGEQL